jgi:PKD repeat protein
LLDSGGPVLHDPAKYSLYWAPSEASKNGQSGTSFTPFPSPGYETTIDGFLSNVAAASGTLGNVYSVDTQYPGEGPGEYKSTFGQAFLDTHAYPARNTTICPVSTKVGDLLPPAGQPCLSDAEGALQIPEELVRFITEYDKTHAALPTGLKAIYYVFTPNEVNSCAGFEESRAACNTNTYCAYHSAFTFGSSKTLVVYANMPYDAVEGCSTPDEPNKGPADDEIDTLSHEDNEAITDPLGNAWFDNAGNEVADKCTYPFFDPTIDNNAEVDAYGQLLGGVPSSGGVGTAFNQSINGGSYLVQREWSNAAGGCVTQAPIPVASFAVYSTPATVGSSVSFNGSGSSPLAGQITSYHWEFGDGQTANGAQVTHTYASIGEFTVHLTVANDSGASATTSQVVTVVEVPPGGQTTTVTTTVTTPAPPPPPPETVTKTVTTTTTAASSVFVPVKPTVYTAAELAAKLGLPGKGDKLSGNGPFALGHAECPPACGVTLQLYAKEPKVSHKHRTSRWVLAGSARLTLGGKGTGALSLSLNAKGKTLLRKLHKLAGKLIVTVEGQDGGSWQIVRSLTIRR